MSPGVVSRVGVLSIFFIRNNLKVIKNVFVALKNNPKLFKKLFFNSFLPLIFFIFNLVTKLLCTSSAPSNDKYHFCISPIEG